MMRGAFRIFACGLALSALGNAQTRHSAQVCDTNDQSDCYTVDTSTIGGIRFEDYRVTNPKAIFYDPALRLKALGALGAAKTQALCQSSATIPFLLSPVSISYTNVQAQILEVSFSSGNGETVQEFLNVTFENFSTSAGYSSPMFGFKMERNRGSTQFVLEIHPGNPGLSNIPGLTSSIGYNVDPAAGTAVLYGAPPASVALEQAAFAVFMNAQSILKAASFTTEPAASGLPLWTSSDLITLAGQAQTIIAATANPSVPPAAPFTCTYPRPDNAYAVCTAADSMDALNQLIIPWGGEYLGLGTSHSFQVLTSNLRAWAKADAPQIDPAFSDAGLPYEYALMGLAKSIVPLWSVLRNDPALSASDAQLIENWLENRIMPRASIPGGVNGAQAFTNNWGYYGASVQMADAIRRGDNQTFANAVQEFYVALNQMRTDGSFPLEAERSACSATYSDVDILQLSTIAEMAATQGYDLWHMGVNGKTLETTIEYFLNAHDNPSLMYQYSKAGGGVCFEGNPGDPPDFTGVFNSNVPSYLAWVEPYLARFPFSATATRLRNAVGSNIAAPPFPLWLEYTGVNNSCAFRTWFEFQPVSGVKITKLAGDAQAAPPGVGATVPLTVQVTDSAGNPLPNTLVSFAVVQGSANFKAPAEVLTDANGMASAMVVAGPVSGPVTLTAQAMGTSVSVTLAVSGPSIAAGGIAGIGGSVPPVTTISPGALFSIYGQDFLPVGTSASANPADGPLPTNLGGVCVTVGGLNAPLLAVLPNQINAVAPAVAPGSTVSVTVITGCGTANAAQSAARTVVVAASSPEFFYFAHNANGQNPVAAVNAVTYGYVGPSSLGTAFLPAHPGDLVSVFGSGFGPTNPPLVPGTVAAGTAQVTSPVMVTLGTVTLAASDVLYVGAAPGEPISQLNIRIPAGVATGNQPLQIRIGSITSPAGAYLTISGQ
ncbi:MAG TPA: alginate lyase family protein [Bryobacteraceae bacterium]|nr:alginate lyase family protein [Bryobacteraceae bacterium]